MKMIKNNYYKMNKSEEGFGLSEGLRECSYILFPFSFPQTFNIFYFID